MSIPSGKAVIGQAFDAHFNNGTFDWTASMAQLEVAAQARAAARGPDYRLLACGLDYSPGHQELHVWHLCLLFAEYTAGILAQKAVEAHCSTSTHGTLCPRASDLHLRMVRHFRRDLKDLIGEIDDLAASIESNQERGVQRAQDLQLG
jgi:hypothetical protein